MAVDRIRQQRTPGQFGASATSLSDPSVGASSFATPGVVDRSAAFGSQAIAIGAQGAANALTGAIKLGQDVKEGFALADLENEQEAAINEYMESKKNPQIAADATIDAATLESTSHSLWAKLGEGSDIADIDAIEQQYRGKMQTLKRANEQGVMSPDEFAQRTLAITREAINRNPHMYNEILAHSKKVLGLSGMDDFLDAEKKAQVSAQDMFKKRVETAMQISKENNIPHRYLPNGSFDLAHAEQMNGIVQQEKFGAEAIARLTSYKSDQEKLNAHAFITGPNGTTAINGIINSVNDTLIGVIRNPENKTDVLTLARHISENAKRELAGRAGPLMHMPGVKDQLDYASKQLDATVATLEKFESKEDQAKFLENQSNMVRNADFINISKQISPQSFKLLTQVLSTVGAGRLLEQNPMVMAKVNSTLGNLLSGVSNGLGTDLFIKDGNGKNLVSSAIDVLAGSAKTDPQAGQVLGSAIEALWGETKSGKMSLEDKFKFYDSYIKSLGNQANKEGFKQLSDVASGKASENLEEYMQLTVGGFKKDLASISNKGADIKLTMLPDGRLNVQTSNQTDSDFLLKRYVVRINDGLRAFANLTGTDTKRAAEVMFPQYEVLNEITKPEPKQEGEGRPNDTNPLNLIVPGKPGKFQSFSNVEEGIRAASAQLDRYFTGKTTGTALKTVSDIAGLWNNEKEKGSASKKDYVANIVKHSGLDPTATLDLTNPFVKADLIYGMAKAEGRSLRPSQILAALGAM